ncbi:hypothetical protein C900_04307 [Fulvivirga imtechensis AK7]|uniref:Outer membrane porin, OprD family n=1 Tax=Fulvivirga imtechensis AK7 TaxID=1237149 RepID=L8JXD3_9BACT|nr:hypothetical protein [Fulvivirga imtechensis]ELR73455.1 hypothetical protein C900_04307 [Fulvivirga imtechensis AK7]
MRIFIASLLILSSLQLVSGQESSAPPQKKGEISGQWRTFFLGTYNKGDLKDFYALATGGKVGYTHSFNNHWQVGGVLYTSINTGIQDLSQPDPVTGKVSRYEAGLFDVEDLSDKLIVIPGELFLKYAHLKHEVTLGRMKIVTPMINPQDGRMIPTLEQGLWYSFAPNKYKVQLGVFNAIAPRSTGEFFDIGTSIGKYPVGRNPDGKESRYAGNTISDFIAMANMNASPDKNIDVELSNYYVDGIFNTIYVRPTIKLGQKDTQLSMEYVRQDRLGDGGNSRDSLRYFTDKNANVLGAQMTFRWNAAKITIGYDHILPGGRFLFPREWGRELLFSFQKRERSEGSADNHALVLTYDQTFTINNDKLRTVFSAGHHWKPPVTDPADNKYAQPGYTHLNFDIFYTSEKLKHLQPELLLVYKIGQGDFPENPNFILNKVDMFQVNFVVNYNF